MQTLVILQDEKGAEFNSALSPDDWLQNGLVESLGQEVEIGPSDNELLMDTYTVVRIERDVEDDVAGEVNAVTLRKQKRVLN